MSFLTDDVMQGFVLDALKLDPANNSIAQHVIDISSSANARAYNEIQRRLTAIGYAQAQIDSWDHGAEYQRDLGLFFAFADEGLNAGERDKNWLELKDRRLELDQVKVIFVGGVAISRTVPTAEFGYGPLNTSTDAFVRNPHQQQGRVTHW
jgi:hypothetical protein